MSRRFSMDCRNGKFFSKGKSTNWSYLLYITTKLIMIQYQVKKFFLARESYEALLWKTNLTMEESKKKLWKN